MPVRGSVVLFLVMLAFVSACGGSASQSRAARTDDCVKGALAGFGSSLPSLDVASRKALRNVCVRGAERGYLDDGKVTREELMSVLRGDPETIAPLCAEAARQGFAQIPPSARSFVGVTPDEWGRGYCRALVEGDYFEADMTLPPSSLTRLYREHPDIAAPFLAAGLMDAYDASLGIPRATFEKIARKVAVEAFRRGLVTARSASHFDIDHPALRALFREIAREFVTE